MSADHTEDHHTMIEEGDTPDELLEHGEEDAEAHALAAEEIKKKKDRQFKLSVIAVAVLGVVGIGGYKILNAPAPRQNGGMAAMTSAPTPASTLTPAAPVAAPAPVPAPAVAPMPSATPTPSAPADPMAPAATAAMPAAPAAVAGDPTIKPADSLSMAPMGAPNPSTLTPSASPSMPVAAAPTTVAAVATASESRPTEGFSRGLDELTKKMDDLKAMFTKFDELNIGDRLAKLEARVNALEGGKSVAKSAPASSSAATGAVTVRHHAHVARSTTKVVPLGESEELLFARVGEARQQAPASSVRPARSQIQAQLATVDRGYVLHAVIPNRIWIKSADGNSQTFENGEMLPDGSKILKIDPDRGDVVTSKGVLRFER